MVLQELKDRLPARDNNKKPGNVRVVCRFRPLNAKESVDRGRKYCCKFEDAKTVSVKGILANGQVGDVKYKFD
jgi:hypothetical protein